MQNYSVMNTLYIDFCRREWEIQEEEEIGYVDLYNINNKDIPGSCLYYHQDKSSVMPLFIYVIKSKLTTKLKDNITPMTIKNV